MQLSLILIGGASARTSELLGVWCETSKKARCSNSCKRCVSAEKAQGLASCRVCVGQCVAEGGVRVQVVAGQVAVVGDELVAEPRLGLYVGFAVGVGVLDLAQAVRVDKGGVCSTLSGSVRRRRSARGCMV